MPGRHSRPVYESVILERYDSNAQSLIQKLDAMREHQKKCSKCRSLPVITKDARPCVYMTEMAIWAASFWDKIRRESSFEQRTLFDENASPWRVN